MTPTQNTALDSGTLTDAPESLPDFLVRTKRLDDNAIARAHAIRSNNTSEKLTDILVHVGLISADGLATGIAEYTGLRRAEPEEFPQERVNLPGLNVNFLKSYRIAPASIGEEDGKLTVLTFDPTDSYIREALSFVCSGEIEMLVATAQEIEQVIERLYISADNDDEDGSGADVTEDVERLRELASDAPVIKFVDRIIEEALLKRASDIHFESLETGLRTRLRVDGILHDSAQATPELATAIVSRIKIMCGLDIAERRIPQDGRMRHRVAGKEVDFRVATAPTAHGEGVVIRLLDKSGASFDFRELGLSYEIGNPLAEAINKPDGIVLVTGPTGSGKTTTLYAGLARLNHPDRKILTIEDPVEYMMEGISQTQVEPKIGRTFSTMLRSFLRLDPDVIMVGEIRDKETAEIAIQAALTGHLVLSTLHTNDAASAVTRLVDMGVESFLISSTVRLVMAQRLIRKVCVECRESYEPDADLLDQWAKKGIQIEGTLYRATGCKACQNTGYMGRALIAEAMEITEELHPLIHQKVDARTLAEKACELGMTTMLDYGLGLAKKGETTVEEILRVTMRR